MLHRINRRRGLGWLLLVAATLAGAQLPDTLPPTPDYRGEIRRGPDGRLMALPEVEARNQRMATIKPATMTVGAGEKVATVSEAARLAKDGEVIEIKAGEYRGQPAVWTQNDLVIRGVGGRPVMLADGKSAEEKAIWVVRGDRVLIQDIAFRGARVTHRNGAGIRFEKGSLVIQRCAFVDNQMGVLTANRPEMTLEVHDSEFSDAPRDSGDLHHLLYVGAIGKFVLRGSRFQNGYLGHLVKSRARENHVFYNLLFDGASGRASYELEFPNGGVAYVVGNLIGQSAGTDNPSLVAYGAEGGRWSENALYLAHNTLINDFPSGKFVNVWQDKLGGVAALWLLNNLTVGRGELPTPGQGRFDGNRSVALSELIETQGVPLRLTSFSPLRGAVRPPGSVDGIELMPDAEFVFPAGTRRMRPASQLAPGAFQ